MTFQEQIYSHTNVAVKPKIGSSQGTRTNAPILGEQNMLLLCRNNQHKLKF